MECWSSGIMDIKNEKALFIGSGALCLRIGEFILRNEGPEARDKGLLAFSLKSAAGGCSSNLYQGNTYS
jgi:hypothetical protein